MKYIIWIGLLAMILVGCNAAPTTTPISSSDETVTGMGMGKNSGMMERHHAVIPEEYATLDNPVPENDESFSRGGAIYATHCASCHGDGGMGDGPAGASLDPAAAPVAHSSQMMGDGYLFWRVSEGGTQFTSAMPAWKETLDEQARWDVINYIRALGEGKVPPASQMGGAMFDPEAQAARQAEMLAQAVTQGVVTQEEADTFVTVHDAMEQYRTEHPPAAGDGLTDTEREAAMLAALVEAGTITQEQADTFGDIHDRLGEAGLMP
jgi:mono/diheme cytochrome c family protein